MTKIRPEKPVSRETDSFERTDALIVTLHPKHLSIRLKGQRKEWSLSYGAALDLARRLDYRSQRKGA